ncbi:MAG: hypothetical protein IT516_17955 [Burkholderiales bacterium]|nr:hypothetical protein [Burkholderiales bacterium]
MRRLTRTAGCVVAGLVALFVALVVYSLWLPRPTAAARPLDRARFAISEQARVRAGLPDPDGATFRNTHVSLMRRVPVLCGEVNERTPGGGYAGYRRFLSGPTIRLHERDIGRADMDRAWLALCDPEAPVPGAAP